MKFPERGIYQVIVGFHLLLMQVQSSRPFREIMLVLDCAMKVMQCAHF